MTAIATIGAERRFRAEAAAHGRDLHPHLAELQAEAVRQFAADAGGGLGGHPDRQAIRPPVGDDRVRLHAAMGLRLRAVFALDHDLGLGKALREIAAACAFPGRARCRSSGRPVATGISAIASDGVSPA